MNLGGIHDPEQFYHKQVLDSIAPLHDVPLFRKSVEKTGRVMDVGFGGGFPLLPLAFCLPQVQFVGIEGSGKKVSAVNSLIAHLNLKNVRCHHIRLENVLMDRNLALTFKAVGSISSLLASICLVESIDAFFYKGPRFFEKENLERVKKNWRQMFINPYHVPDTDGRILIGFKGDPPVKRAWRETPTRFVRAGSFFSTGRKI